MDWERIWSEHLCWQCETLVLLCYERRETPKGLLASRDVFVGRTNVDGTPHYCLEPEPAPAAPTPLPARGGAPRARPARTPVAAVPDISVEVPRVE